jgi:hypothetical protein
MVNEISLFRGDTETITCTVVDDAGAAFNLTSYTMILTVKEKFEDSDAEAKLQKTATIASPATGIGVFTLDSDDTNFEPNIYYYDIQINNATNTVKTIIVSTFEVKKEYTNTTA